MVMIGSDAVPVADLDAADAAEARDALRPCCASGSWLAIMIAGRPYHTLDALTSASDRALSRLSSADVEEALAAHPRIGERSARTGEGGARAGEGDGGREAAWSRQEQSATATIDRSTADELVAGNAAYEERFGHVFLIRATGRSTEEMLAQLRARLGHDAATEQDVVRRELAEIVRIRLAKAFR
jgi:2-oxo-4-hydroxy-4-carboxy-5-ureidoimidazoline decarboxylase